MELEYAFRDEKVNIFAMTIGGLNHSFGHQIFICKTKPLIERPYLLDSNKGRSPKYPMSSEGQKYFNKISDTNFEHKYVGIIDCQININIKNKVFYDLIDNNLFNVWQPEAPIRYFKDMKQGYLVVFRVYNVNKVFKLKYKARQNYIYKLKNNILYDSAVMSSNSIKLDNPVINNSEFNKIKKHLLTILQRNDCIVDIIKPMPHKPTVITLKWQIDEIDSMICIDIDAELVEENGYDKEGKAKKYYGRRYERSSYNRQQAIRYHGLSCNVCGFNFEKIYGARGAEYIEVHHINPISSYEEEIVVDPKSDMITVCSNCHRMIHRRSDDVLSIEEMQALLNR